MTESIKKIQDKQAREFAEACYNQNSLKELISGIHSYEQTLEADAKDMETWQLTEPQWFQAIKTAAADKVRNWLWEWAHDNAPDGDDVSLSAEQVIAEKTNVDAADVEIDGAGDVFAGVWLSDDKLIEFYGWYQAAYGA